MEGRYLKRVGEGKGKKERNSLGRAQSCEKRGNIKGRECQKIRKGEECQTGCVMLRGYRPKNLGHKRWTPRQEANHQEKQMVKSGFGTRWARYRQKTEAKKWEDTSNMRERGLE